MQKQHGIFILSFLTVSTLLLLSGLVVVTLYFSTLHNKRQQLVDIAAVSAASELNGDSGSIYRSKNVAKQVLRMPESQYTIQFYSFPTTLTDVDSDAGFVRITLRPILTSSFYIKILSGLNSSFRPSLAESASASNNICQLPPFFICDNANGSFNTEDIGIFSIANLDNTFENIKPSLLENVFSGCYPFVITAKRLDYKQVTEFKEILSNNKVESLNVAYADCSRLKSDNLINTKGNYVVLDLKKNKFSNDNLKLVNYARLES